MSCVYSVVAGSVEVAWGFDAYCGVDVVGDVAGGMVGDVAGDVAGDVGGLTNRIGVLSVVLSESDRVSD